MDISRKCTPFLFISHWSALSFISKRKKENRRENKGVTGETVDQQFLSHVAKSLTFIRAEEIPALGERDSAVQRGA